MVPIRQQKGQRVIMFSVIIPNYNQEKYIRSAIQSVLEQTCRDFEIIVVDDGSTDQSKAIIDEFGEQVRYLWQENQGLAGARNTGIRAARGEYIALLDADDIWLPGYLEKIKALIEQHPGAVVFYTAAFCMDQQGRPLTQKLGLPVRDVSDREKLYQSLLRGNYIIPSTVTIRKDVIVEAGLFDPTLRSCEDIDLWLRIAQENSFVGTGDCLIRYRLHPASLSKNSQKMIQSKHRVIEKKFGADDGQWSEWPQDKQRAYGGAYRYQATLLVCQENDWLSAAPAMQKAFLADPSLAQDVNFFYELALGSQPKGSRDAAGARAILENAGKLLVILESTFSGTREPRLLNTKPAAYATAHYAVALALYHAGDFARARRHFWLAGRYSPSLALSSALLPYLLRSLLGGRFLHGLRRLKQSLKNSR